MTYLSSQLGLELKKVFMPLWGCLSEPGLSIYISLPPSPPTTMGPLSMDSAQSCCLFITQAAQEG